MPPGVPMPLSSLQMYRSVTQEECKEAEGGDPSPLLSPGDIWMLGPVLQKRHELNEVSSPKGPEDDQGTGDPSYKGRLWELWLLSLEKRGQRGLVIVYNYPMGE